MLSHEKYSLNKQMTGSRPMTRGENLVSFARSKGLTITPEEDHTPSPSRAPSTPRPRGSVSQSRWAKLILGASDPGGCRSVSVKTRGNGALHGAGCAPGEPCPVWPVYPPSLHIGLFFPEFRYFPLKPGSGVISEHLSPGTSCPCIYKSISATVEKVLGLKSPKKIWS